jgi:hypothetical protein
VCHTITRATAGPAWRILPRYVARLLVCPSWLIDLTVALARLRCVARRSLDSLLDCLAAQRYAWVRGAARRLDDGGWELALLEITIGEPPPRWRQQKWCYPTAVFFATRRAGTTVARWLSSGRIPVSKGTAKVDLDESVGVERRYSSFEGIYEQLLWPTVEWDVHITGSSRHNSHDDLVAADAPAFLNFDLAAAEFFGVSQVRDRNFAGCAIVVREQDRRARIESVRVRPTEVVVQLEGQQLKGASLTLGGSCGTRKRLSPRSRQVRLLVPAALGDGAWLALHCDHELLDRRILDPRWGGKDFDVEIDAATRLAMLVGGGEQAGVEFKRELPGRDPSGVMKTVAAFANGAGGSVLFGVEDDGRVAGLGEAYTAASRDRLTNMIRDWVHPLPVFQLEMIDTTGGGVIAVNVASGSDTPYGIATNGRSVSYFVRRAGTTFPASPADVRGFVEARVASTTSLQFPNRRR